MNTITQGQSAWPRPPDVLPGSSFKDPSTQPPDTSEDGFNFFGEDGLTFSDFIDIINPLQHLPLVSTMYRQITGDQIDPGSRIAGGTLFFGPIGTAISGANVMLEHNTGKDIGQHVMALLDDDAPQPGPETPVEIAAFEQANNPVSDWARAELAYRAGEARRQQGDPAPRLARADASPPGTPAASEATQKSLDPLHNASLFNLAAQQNLTAPLQPTALAVDLQPSMIPQSRPSTATKKDAPDAAAVLAALGVPKDAWPQQSTPRPEQPEKPHARQTPGPSSMASDTQPIILSEAQPGQIAPVDSGGKWFSSSMAGALEKYYQANAAKNSKSSAGLDLVN